MTTNSARQNRVSTALAAETALALAMEDDPTFILADTIQLRDDADRALRGLTAAELRAVATAIDHA